LWFNPPGPIPIKPIDSLGLHFPGGVIPGLQPGHTSAQAQRARGAPPHYLGGCSHSLGSGAHAWGQGVNPLQGLLGAQGAVSRFKPPCRTFLPLPSGRASYPGISLLSTKTGAQIVYILCRTYAFERDQCSLPGLCWY